MEIRCSLGTAIGMVMAVAISTSAIAQDLEARTPPPQSGPWTEFVNGQWALGAGTTYQYDGSSGSTLAFGSWTGRDDHYEVAAIRFMSAQTRRSTTLAPPDWVAEVSRRWRLRWDMIDRSGLQLFVGAGAAYKDETDRLNGSRLNFAEQLGWRFPVTPNGGRVEFVIRHISNAGLKKPNRGEDFLTFAYVFGS